MPTSPDEIPAAAAHLRELLAEHGPEQAAEALWAEIQAADPFPVALARELVRLEGPGRFRRDDETGRVATAVEALQHATGVLQGRAAGWPSEWSKASLELAALLGDRTRVVSAAEAAAHGVEVATLLRSPAFRLDPRVRAQVDASVTVTAQRSTVRRAERLTAYQSSTLRRGRLVVDDPRTGARAAYLGYFVHFGTVVYRFGTASTGSRPEDEFYLIVGGVAGQLLGVYLPGPDLGRICWW
ncbi:MAG: hypothetical protein QM638_17225 [Nocardioides sp.]|uniref:hypothetical protein n=1 Tax=Nocardioides sp. TaxID=35761 RepID=UPI0039E3F48F